MGILAYGDIYELCEELQQLKGTSLQEASSWNLTRHALFFRMPGITKILVVDLTPSQPFFLSTDSTKIKLKNKPTPVSNFLRAHCVGSRLQKIEVAQKPNRTLRIEFSNGVENQILQFKCFPHGQELSLTAEGKSVVSPRRAKDVTKIQEDENVVFVEPESVNSWALNDIQFQNRFAEKPPKPEITEPKVSKFEKALENFDKAQIEKEKETLNLIAELKTKALEMGQTEKLDGTQYNSIFDKIKKLKTGLLSSRQRRNEILKKIERVKELKGDEPVNVPKTQRIKAFPGTRTQLDPHWELWVGRNASQNDELIKMAAPEDLWIHLRDYAGAHGILKGPKKKEPPFEILEKACCIVAKLSQAKKNPFVQGQKLDFIVVPRKFVKKPKGAMPGRVNVEREKVRRVVYKTVEFEVS